MNQDYLDKDKSALEYLAAFDPAFAETDAGRLSTVLEHLTLLQSSFLDVIARGKKRVLIESSLVNGKSTALILYLLTHRPAEEEPGALPLVTVILPNKIFMEKFIGALKPFVPLFEARGIEVSYLTSSDAVGEATTKPDSPVMRVTVGSIKDTIGLFRENEQAVGQLDSVIIDDLDLAVSLGQANNVKRFLEYVSKKRPGFFTDNRLLITVKEDILEEISTIKETIGEKFVNIRITRNFDDEIAQLDEPEEPVEPDGQTVPTVLNQYFHLNTEKHLYCMLFLLFKFRVYPENYLLVADSVNEAYRLKLFMERANIVKAVKVYSPIHPITLKAYHLSLFNAKQSEVLVITKDFLDDLQKNKAKLPKLRRVRNILLFNCSIGYEAYMSYVELLQAQPSYYKSVNDFNIINLVANDKEKATDQGNDDDSDDEAQGPLASFNELSAALNRSGSQLEPVPINKSDVQLFEYRIKEVLSSLSRRQVKLYQLIEVKKLMLKSKRMKKYFIEHPKERDLLLAKLQKLTKEFKKYEIKLPSEVPSYLTPSFLKAERKSKANKLDYILKRSKKENPLLRDSKTLPVLGSHKQWKIRHRIKKVPLKRRLKKGLYDV